MLRFAKFVRPQVIGSVMLSLALVGCGGGGGGGGNDAPQAAAAPAAQAQPAPTTNTTTSTAQKPMLTGRFLDSAVANARYITLDASGKVTMSGFTDENGAFSYNQGDTVSFYIGDILLGKAAAQSIVTPVALVADAKNTDALPNMLRFLQTLDSDAAPENGIQITDSVHQNARGLQVDFDKAMKSFEVQSSLTQLIAMATNSPTLPDVAKALTHFRETLLNTYDTNSGDTVLNLVNTTWKGTLSSADCPNNTASITHTFNLLGHFTNGFHTLTPTGNGTCAGDAAGVLMALYENDAEFSCANGCTLADLNRSVQVQVPVPHVATLVYQPNTQKITIVHQYTDGREVVETLEKQ